MQHKLQRHICEPGFRGFIYSTVSHSLSIVYFIARGIFCTGGVHPDSKTTGEMKITSSSNKRKRAFFFAVPLLNSCSSARVGSRFPFWSDHAPSWSSGGSGRTAWSVSGTLTVHEWLRLQLALLGVTTASGCLWIPSPSLSHQGTHLQASGEVLQVTQHDVC